MSFKFPEIDLSGVNKAMEDFNNTLANIAEDIQKRKDNAMAMEFTRIICELLKENGVSVQMQKYELENHATNKFEVKYGVSFTGLDFYEHDKNVAEEKDKDLEIMRGTLSKIGQECARLEKCNSELKRKIEDLESIIADGKKTDICVSENGVSMGCECGGYHLAKKKITELDDRHQSDCIRINQLLTTIDVLTERYQKLKEIHGL